MISRISWRWAAVWLVAVTLAGMAFALTAAAAGWLLDEEAARYLRGLRELVVPIVDRIPNQDAFADLQLVLAIPDVTGIEIFGEEGRRIWHAGESLEIVGYRFSERSTLSHATADATRYEVFWSAQALQARHGIALRLDVGRRGALLRRFAVRAAALSALLLVAGIALGMTAFRHRTAMRNE